MGNPFTLRIGEVATQSGVTRDALRYYERFGVLPRPHRTSSGYRVYAPAVLNRLRFIKQAQAHGLTLAEIRNLLAFGDRGGRERCRNVQRLLSLRIAELDRKVVELHAFKLTLERYAKQCQRVLEGSADSECPVVMDLEKQS
ncbi:MAG: heavy metal-responsive transcriptional regulator [Vicinamibacteraceae bacterium]